MTDTRSKEATHERFVDVDARRRRSAVIRIDG